MQFILTIAALFFLSFSHADTLNYLQKSLPSAQMDSYENTPILQSTLNPEILAEFIPLIMEEMANEFAHQNDTRTRRNTLQYGFNFFKMLKGDFTYTPPPEFLQQLGTHICKTLGHDPVEFTNIILSF